MSEVFLCTKGQLNRAGRHDLRQAGIVVVEVEDVTACQFIRSSEVVTSDDMLWATLDALNLHPQYDDTGKAQRERLAVNLLTIVNEDRAKRRGSRDESPV